MNKTTYKTTHLTPAKKKFAQVYAQTDNATEAVRQAFPDSASKSKRASLAVKGNRLLNNVNVLQEIIDQKEQLTALANQSIRKLGSHINSDDESISLNASKFTIEQVHGKATVKVESKSAHVSVVYNLGGVNAPPIPADIQAKIQK